MKKNLSVLDMFFSLGDKVTGGDPARKMDFDYYMLWIIFLAFAFIFIGNIYKFFFGGYQLQYLGWSFFGLAIMWFQYFNLKNSYAIRKMQKEARETIGDSKEHEIEDVGDMLDGFRGDNSQEKK